MKCEKTITKFDQTAGRELTTCAKFDGPADGELGGFAFAPSGLHWGWGVGAGLAASVVAGQLGDILFSKEKDAAGNLSQTPDATRAKYAFGLGAGVPAAIGLVMAFFRSTRTAGWGMIGAGLAGGLVQYFISNSGKHAYSLTGDLGGMIAARQQLMGARGVQILGLPVAKEIRGADVQIMGGADGAQGPVEVMQGGFGASFGTNFAKQ